MTSRNRARRPPALVAAQEKAGHEPVDFSIRRSGYGRFHRGCAGPDRGASASRQHRGGQAHQPTQAEVTQQEQAGHDGLTQQQQQQGSDQIQDIYRELMESTAPEGE